MSKQKKAGRPPKYPKPAGPGRSVKRFQVSMRPVVFDALEQFRRAQQFMPERSEIIEKLVERHLVATGFLLEGASDGK